MEKIPQLEAYFSHVVSQWTYRWMPLPYEELGKTQRYPLCQLRQTFLHEYARNQWLSDNSFPWVKHAQAKGLSLSALVTLVYEQICLAQEHQVELLDFFHPLYPPLLAMIADPPNLLMAKGSLALLEQKAISIVGSRKASRFAREETYSLANSLASEGYVIVSGGALGCDISSHLGALSVPQRPVPTILVFAGGLSRLYPRCHEPYFRELATAGALFLSERLWSYPARPYDFPVRNRIISGLSLKLLVMQAGERSGAKLTAGLALEQGREVYVLIHDTSDIRAKGSQILLEDGAIPFHNSQDFLSLPYLLG